jgi:4'-phosphopantetheinyl transferase
MGGCYLQPVAAQRIIDVWQVRAEDRCAGRAALRRILARYAGGDPDALGFASGVRGKPRLLGHDLQFSYSRSGSCALVAVSASGLQVGVDVERVKAGRAVDRIARRRFAREEAAALAHARPGARDIAFHRCWTGKEAYAKGIGAGLAVGLASFSVAGLIDGRQPCAVGAWEVRPLAAPAGHVAAVAAPGSAWQVRLREQEGRDG